MNLDAAQAEMRERSKKARSRTAARNASGSKKKKGLRSRASEKSLLVGLAGDPDVKPEVRLEAIRLLLMLNGKLPAEEKSEEPKPETPVADAPRYTGADLEPAKL